MGITVEELVDNKSVVCEEMLRALPEYFGIEKYVQEYVSKVAELTTYVVWNKKESIGFLSLVFHNIYTAEIYVMGVKNEFQGKGIGKQLVSKAVESVKEKNCKFLMVKTLGPSHEDSGYAKTRRFYESCGFYPLEELKTFWDENNPCLLMVKLIK